MEQSVLDPAANYELCVGSAVVKILKVHSVGFVTFLETTHPQNKFVCVNERAGGGYWYTTLITLSSEQHENTERKTIISSHS